MTFYRFFHILLNFSGKTMGARVTMRIWTTGLVAICLAIGGAGPRAAAQVALPSAQLPEAGRVLSTLPDTGVLEPLVETSERLTQLRLDRIGALVRSHRDSIELDDRGEPAVRGVLIATGVDDAMIGHAAKAGFALIERERIEGLDLDLARFAVPEGRRLARARKQLAKLLPAAAVDAERLPRCSSAAAR